MFGRVSFHPIDLQFFDELIQPLLEGKKVNPESYLERAMCVRAVQSCTDRYIREMEFHMEAVKPPPPPAEGKLWDKVRARLEQFDFRPDPVSVLVARSVEPELHLSGRPFLITEGSGERVAQLVDEYLGARSPAEAESLVLEQLIRLNPKLGGSLNPEGDSEGFGDPTYRRELLDALRQLFDLAQAAGKDEMWGRAGTERRAASEVLVEELPWRATLLQSRALPYWMATDVVGLVSVCRAANVPEPDFLVPAWRLFGEICETFPQLRERLHVELRAERDVGCFVAPDDIPSLLKFLGENGAAIIRAAAQVDEGPACKTLLRKIRECCRFAESKGFGYLEASGIPAQGVASPEEELDEVLV
jgi:hypothetical protein